MDATKVCIKCKRELPARCFPPQKVARMVGGKQKTYTYHRSYCKQCNKKDMAVRFYKAREVREEKVHRLERAVTGSQFEDVLKEFGL